MKLSNKILIGFFALIFIYLTAAFAEVRLRGIPNVINDSNSVSETANIAGVTYLILRDADKAVNVIGSDQPRLEIRSFSGDLLQSINPRVSGDTLTLSNLREEDIRGAKISVFIPKSVLKGITVDSAMAIVQGLEQEVLDISQHGGRIWMSESRIGTIRLQVTGRSHLNISTTTVDTLSAMIDGSDVYIHSPVTLLEGSMKNKSFLRLGDIKEINFKKDESSRLNLYQ